MILTERAIKQEPKKTYSIVRKIQKKYNQNEPMETTSQHPNPGQNIQQIQETSNLKFYGFKVTGK